MDKRIIELWDKNKDKLRGYFTKTNQSEYDSYSKLVKIIITKILNNDEYDYKNPNYNTNNITVIDDGDWQGTQLFLIPQDTYQPNATEYLVTHVYYGSCSGCDTLQAINTYDYGLPNEIQVEDYMKLCLHLVQNMKPLYTEI